MNPFNTYLVLDILPCSGDDDIKAAHRRLSRQHHPDREGGDAEKFVLVQQAFAMVRDAKARRVLREQLRSMGDECESCRGTGEIKTVRKFQVVGSAPCEWCRRTGYHERKLKR